MLSSQVINCHKVMCVPKGHAISEVACAAAAIGWQALPYIIHSLSRGELCEDSFCLLEIEFLLGNSCDQEAAWTLPHHMHCLQGQAASQEGGRHVQHLRLASQHLWHARQLFQTEAVSGQIHARLICTNLISAKQVVQYIVSALCMLQCAQLAMYIT